MVWQAGDLRGIAGHSDQLVALFVDQQLTLGAFEALATQSPNAIVTKSAKGSLKKKMTFKLRRIHMGL